MTRLVVTGHRELAALGKRLKAAGDEGKQLQKELRKAVRKAAKPALADAKKAVKAIPITAKRASHGGGYKQRQGHKPLKRNRGLRGRVAAAMGMEFKAGPRTASVRLRVASKALPADQQKLPRYLDSTKGWRHPLFGNRKVWIHQVGAPYWEVTLKRHGPKVRAEVLDAMDTIAKKITKG